MAGPEDMVAEPRDRWAKAEQHSHGVTDNGLGSALRRYYTHYFPIGALIILGLTITGGYLLAGDGPIHWQRTLSLAAILAGFASIIGSTIYERDHLTPSVHLGSSNDLLSLLEKDGSKELIRVINGKAPIDAGHLTVARAVAIQQRKKTASTLLGAPAFLPILSLIGTPLGWFSVALMAALLIVTMRFIRNFRRQGRFLATTA